MKRPHGVFNGVNLDDPIGKTVGRRRVTDGFAYGMKLQKAGGELLKAFGCHGIPRGVYRFSSHEEADAWMRSATRAAPR